MDICLFVSVVCCQVEVSAASWSIVRRSPTDCGASLCVIQKPQEWGGHDPRWVAAPQKKKEYIYIYIVIPVIMTITLKKKRKSVVDRFEGANPHFLWWVENPWIKGRVVYNWFLRVNHGKQKTSKHLRVFCFRFANLLCAVLLATRIRPVLWKTHFRPEAAEQSSVISWPTSYLEPSQKIQWKDE